MIPIISHTTCLGTPHTNLKERLNTVLQTIFVLENTVANLLNQFPNATIEQRTEDCSDLK